MIPLVLSIHMFNYVFPLYMMEPVFGSFYKYPSIQALEINGVLLKKHFIGYYFVKNHQRYNFDTNHPHLP